MKTNKPKHLLIFALIILLASCSSILFSTGQKLNKLELGMTKEQVTKILGRDYIIAEKRIEGGSQIEVLSYKEYYKDELYMLVFSDGKLEKWYRELVPYYEVKKQ